MLEPEASIHQPTRLRIMMLLSGVTEAELNLLLGTLGLTNGNLSVQTGKLEQVGYVEITKSFVGKMPRTMYQLTDLGRERLAEYWETMDAIRASTQRAAAAPQGSETAAGGRAVGPRVVDRVDVDIHL